MQKILLMAGLASMIGFASFAKTLTVQVANIHGSSGMIRITASTGHAEFADLPAGTYGIALYYDATETKSWIQTCSALQPKAMALATMPARL